MIYPRPIKEGDTIGITATSGGIRDEINKARLVNAIRSFTHIGYNIIKTENLKPSVKGRSSPKEERAKQFMRLVQDEKIQAIITSAGGDFLLEILPYIDFEEIKKNPKWVQGYSDTTGLTFLITTICDICTMYTQNFGTFGMEKWHASLEDNLDILEGEDFAQKSFEQYEENGLEESTGLEGYHLDTKVEWKNGRGEEEINISGRMIGGCIDVLTYLVGTRFDRVSEFLEKYKEDGFIWFFDNYEYTSERIVLALLHLKEAGWLKDVKGIVFGRTTIRKSEFGIPFEEAVMDAVEELNVPVIFEVDIGHKPPTFTVLNGAIVEVTSKDGKGTIKFERK